MSGYVLLIGEYVVATDLPTWASAVSAQEKLNARAGMKARIKRAQAEAFSTMPKVG